MDYQQAQETETQRKNISKRKRDCDQGRKTEKLRFMKANNTCDAGGEKKKT